MNIKKIIGGLSASSMLFFATLTPALAATVVVSPSNLNGWNELNYDAIVNADSTSTTTSGSDNLFVVGPGTPPLGTGSLKQIIGTNGDDVARMRRADFNGQPLSSLTELAYSTYVTDNNGGQAPYMRINVDRDNNGTTDDALFFEPVYQTGGYGMLSYSPASVPNQCVGVVNCVKEDEWQTWDADTGGWWSNVDSAGGPPLTTLANYIAEYPTAKVATDTDAVRIVSGSGGAAWVNFVGYVDNVTINGTTYNFELENPTPTITVTPSPSVTVSPSPTVITPTPIANLPVACTGMTFTNVINGTNKSETLNGTSGNDLIFGGNGSDFIDGKGGNDCIAPGNGSNIILGGAGDDVIIGGNSSDSINGEAGMDKIYGNNGSDYLAGGADADMIWGGNGSDLLTGDAGADMLYGDAGSDLTSGGAGSDTCVAESKNSCEL